MKTKMKTLIPAILATIITAATAYTLHHVKMNQAVETIAAHLVEIETQRHATCLGYAGRLNARGIYRGDGLCILIPVAKPPSNKIPL